MLCSFSLLQLFSTYILVFLIVHLAVGSTTTRFFTLYTYNIYGQHHIASSLVAKELRVFIIYATGCVHYSVLPLGISTAQKCHRFVRHMLKNATGHHYCDSNLFFDVIMT